MHVALFVLTFITIHSNTLRAASELVLAPDFRFSVCRDMPRTASPSGMQITRQQYRDENAIEWQIRLQAPKGKSSPLYTQLHSADFTVVLPAARRVTLHWNEGSRATAADFRPRSRALRTGRVVALQSFGGRSSDGVMPYFNLATDNGGLVVAIGWSGDWKASFEMLTDGSVHITAGLKHARFRLDPGERVRLPSVLVMGYSGRRMGGQNRFRRLMLRHFTPTNHKPMVLMPVAASVHGQFGFNDTSQDNLITLVNDITAFQLPLDTIWLDAGWNRGGFPHGQGNPEPDPVRFPDGLRMIGRTVRTAGMRFLVWFEPERVMRGTWLDQAHPDWLLLPSKTPPDLRYLEKDGFRLLDLGNASARQWAVNSVSKQIRDARISIYRQDFNAYPAFFWHTGEQADETGLHEVRYITGLYDFLDEIARRHPDVILDNCASGGRRLDFEMMRRCVALWRSDSCWDDKSFPRNVQSMTYGLSHWLPLHGLGASTTDTIALRSGMGACATYAVDFRDATTVAALRKHLLRYLSVRHLFAADFYPLTPASDNHSEWLAFQFHDPRTHEGMVQAFRGKPAGRTRATNAQPTATPDAAAGFRVKLQGLEPNRLYAITDWDRPNTLMQETGQQLHEHGIAVPAHDEALAIVFHYKGE